MSDKNAGKTVENNVVVHKANLPMDKGESVYDFTSKLSEAARAFVITKLNGDANKDSCYSMEVYTATVVCSTYMYKSGGAGKSAYYSVSYERKEDGSFNFSDLTEVERVTTYRPKTMKLTVKSAGQPAEVDVFEHSAGAPGFEPTVKAKSVSWSGVL